MGGFNLGAYLDRYQEVCKREFQRAYDFRPLEKVFSHLRDPRRALSLSDIENLFDPQRTPFGKFWPAPTKELRMALKQRRIVVALDKTQPENLLKELLGVFHNVGIASLVLRFTYPERFGIFSTPVIHLLNVRRPTTIDLYLAYCNELLEWQKRFKLDSAAEVEMALWAFHKISQTPDGRQSRLDFEGDTWVQRRRLEQSLGPFLDRYGWLDLAYILAKRDPNVAALIAGREYAKFLRQQAKILKISCTEKWERQVLDKLGQRGGCDAIEMRKVWDRRNDVSHDRAEIDEAQAELMIEQIRRFMTQV